MKITIDRAVLTVSQADGVWSVECAGAHFGHSPYKEIAKAAASRHARQLQDTGHPCQIRVAGEHGF